MNFECPNCKKSGQIEDSKIPEAGVNAICPHCNSKFLVKRDKPKDFAFEPVEQPIPKVTPSANSQSAAPKAVAPPSSGPSNSPQSESIKVSFWVGKPMRYLYACIACFVVLVFAAAIKSSLGWEPNGGGAIPAMIVISVLVGTWYVITKLDKVWIAYLVIVIFTGIIGTIAIPQFAKPPKKEYTEADIAALRGDTPAPLPAGYTLDPVQPAVKKIYSPGWTLAYTGANSDTYIDFSTINNIGNDSITFMTKTTFASGKVSETRDKHEAKCTEKKMRTIETTYMLLNGNLQASDVISLEWVFLPQGSNGHILVVDACAIAMEK